MEQRLLNNEALFAECREDHFRGSGPGGQKRNKTSNGVRLVHTPTGLIVTATESRSLKLNRLHAIRRIRLKIATDVREPIDLPTFEPPDWFVPLRHGKGFEVAARNPLFAATSGLVLDLLAVCNGNPGPVAINLGVSTTAVIKLLESDSHLWAAANRIRAELGFGSLTHRR